MPVKVAAPGIDEQFKTVIHHGAFLQAISLLIQDQPTVSAVPPTSRIHEACVCTLNKRTSARQDGHFDVLRDRGLEPQISARGRRLLRQPQIIPLLAKGHQLLSRVRSNAVAYFPPPSTRRKKKVVPGPTAKVRLKV
jgi:hypothetical protein